MTLVLDADDVAALCDMKELVAAIERGLLEEAAGELEQPSRLNIPMRFGMLRLMPVAMNGSGLFGFKAFHWTDEGARYLVSVYEQDHGELLALVDGNFLTAARTGATAAVAAKQMARIDATRVAVIGSGMEARTNLATMCVVRDIAAISVFSPRAERRETFAEWIDNHLGIEARVADDPEDCVGGCDIVIVATNTGKAADPIAFRGAWMAPGMHVSSIGSTMPQLRELDTDTFAGADRVVVDSPSQMAEECGDVIAALAEGVYDEPAALYDVVGGVEPGRTRDDEITLFKSVGAAMQDVVAGHMIYQAALRAGRGQKADFLHLKAV